MQKFKDILQWPLWRNQWMLFSLWMLMIVISVGLHMHKFNNFLIYKFTFWHAIDGKSIFENHGDHGDVNHYGPIFSIIIAPFALVSGRETSLDSIMLWLGVFLWHLALGVFLWWAIRKSPLTTEQKVVIIWFTAHEMLNALGMSQFNVATAAMILLSYIYIRRDSEMWSTFWIVLGTLTKMYGIVGLAFFFFAKSKPKFIMWLVIWSVVLFVIPMPFFGAKYVAEQYIEWILCLADKSQENLLSDFQNISLLGFVRKIGYACSAGLNAYYAVFDRRAIPDMSNWWIARWNDLYLIIPGIIYGALPYLRIGQYKSYYFQFMCLASVLMFANIFSTGAENSSYIISMLGVGIWYVAVPWERSRTDLWLMIFCFFLTSLSPTDLFPEYLRTHWIRPFALKSIPVVVIWLKLIWEMCTRNYNALSPCEPLVTSK